MPGGKNFYHRPREFDSCSKNGFWSFEICSKVCVCLNHVHFCCRQQSCMQPPAARGLALDSASHSGLRTDRRHVRVYTLSSKGTHFGCPLNSSRWGGATRLFSLLTKISQYQTCAYHYCSCYNGWLGSDGIRVPLRLSGLTVYLGKKSQTVLLSVFKQCLWLPPSLCVLFILTLQTVSMSKKGIFFFFFLSRIVYCAIPRYLKEQDRKTWCMWRSTVMR